VRRLKPIEAVSKKAGGILEIRIDNNRWRIAMPQIEFSTGRKLSKEQKENIVKAFGKVITVLPGKTEPDLMLDIEDDKELYLGGKRTDGAYINMKMYLNTPMEDKKNFTEAVFVELEKLGFSKDTIYMTITGMDHWCVGGTMK
jgi:hypothetical protein